MLEVRTPILLGLCEQLGDLLGVDNHGFGRSDFLGRNIHKASGNGGYSVNSVVLVSRNHDDIPEIGR
jgi:hypothetical protein